MKVYQDESGQWRVGDGANRVSQVFPSEEAAKKYLDKRVRSNQSFDRMMQYPGKIIPVEWLEKNAANDFDSIHETGKRLKEILKRDRVNGLDGMEDYLVRAVEEAARLTQRVPDWVYWRCDFCTGLNIYTNRQCAHCGKPPSR